MNQDSHVCGCCGRKRAPRDSDYVSARSSGSCCSGTRVSGAQVLGCGGQCYGACSVRRYPPGDRGYTPPLGPYSYGPPGILAEDVGGGNEEARAALLDFKDSIIRGTGPERRTYGREGSNNRDYDVRRRGGNGGPGGRR